MSETTQENQTGEPRDLGNVHVLVIEDKMDSYSIIVRLLERAGVSVHNHNWKANGLDIVNFVENHIEHEIDLILLDLGLPNEDGYAILTRLRQIPHFAQTPIVAVTGHVDVEEMRRAQVAGFSGFLGKPLDKHRFPGQIQRILAGEPVWENV